MGSFRSLRHYLRNGGIIAYPTESVFGLGCDPQNHMAVQRLLDLKGRPQRKGLILIASEISQLQPFIAPLTELQIATVSKTWPGPHTWLVPPSKKCPVWLKGRHKTIAVRVTAHKLVRKLCHETGLALVSTSANRSGCRPAKTVAECFKLFGSQVRIIEGLTGGARRPSTIQDLASGRIFRR